MRANLACLALYSLFILPQAWACEDKHPSQEAQEAGTILAEASAPQAKKILIDVRNADEYQSGHLDQAIHIPYQEIAQRIGQVASDKNQPIALYCGSGRRAGLAKEALEKLGYTQVVNWGGYKDLKEKGQPF